MVSVWLGTLPNSMVKSTVGVEGIPFLLLQEAGTRACCGIWESELGVGIGAVSFNEWNEITPMFWEALSGKESKQNIHMKRKNRSRKVNGAQDRLDEIVWWFLLNSHGQVAIFYSLLKPQTLLHNVDLSDNYNIISVNIQSELSIQSLVLPEERRGRPLC